MKTAYSIACELQAAFAGKHMHMCPRCPVTPPLVSIFALPQYSILYLTLFLYRIDTFSIYTTPTNPDPSFRADNSVIKQRQILGSWIDIISRSSSVGIHSI
jgi:hypothetical protein